MTYKEYILSIIDTRGLWNDEVRKNGCERHHIILRCKGGQPKKLDWEHHPNVIWLYPREHFIAHKLLAIENHNDKLCVFAWSRMAFCKGKTNRKILITANEYETLRRLQSEHLKHDNNYLKGGHPWNYGLTKETSEKVRVYSEKQSVSKKGLKLGHRTELLKHNMSVALKLRAQTNPESYKAHNKGKIAVTNGSVTKYIGADLSVPEGFYKGASGHDHYNIKDRELLHKIRSNHTSGSKNPMYGKGYKVSGGKNGHATILYTYKGVTYECRKDLVRFLKQYFPKISASTIRKIVSGNYKTSIKRQYKDVIDNLSWRDKEK